jgi:hypothetical protein
MQLNAEQELLLRQLIKYILTTEWDGYNDTKDKHGEKVAAQHIFAKAQTLKQLLKD